MQFVFKERQNTQQADQNTAVKSYVANTLNVGSASDGLLPRLGPSVQQQPQQQQNQQP